MQICIVYRLTDAKLASKNTGGWTWEDEELENLAMEMLVRTDTELKLLSDPIRSSWWNMRRNLVSRNALLI